MKWNMERTIKWTKHGLIQKRVDCDFKYMYNLPIFQCLVIFVMYKLYLFYELNSCLFWDQFLYMLFVLLQQLVLSG